MKRVVSVSLGSSTRDKTVQVELEGQQFQIERIGTDGDFDRFAQLVEKFDGQVEAICFGGIDIYIHSAGRRYAFRDALKLASHARRSPVVDGSGLKNTLERETIQYLAREGIVDFPHSKVLLVCGVDRFGMAAALVETGCNILFGDLMFNLGLPIAIRSPRVHRLLAFLLLPILVRLPFKWYYPTGEKQTKITPKYEKHYHWADVIAGDFLLIRKHLAENLSGKTIITNTTTPDDVLMLKERGVETLVTTTPSFEGRSFGTNIMEGIVITLLGKSPQELTADEYFAAIKDLGWQPNVRRLQEES